jgi:hypothetical protein
MSISARTFQLVHKLVDRCWKRRKHFAFGKLVLGKPSPPYFETHRARELREAAPSF